MKIYVASGLANIDRAAWLNTQLRGQGHDITYDWTVHGPAGHLGPAGLGRIAEKESRGVLEADVLIVLLPGARGTHVEIGLALAAGRPVIIWDETQQAFADMLTTCAFYFHPRVFRVQGPVDLAQLSRLLAETWLTWPRQAERALESENVPRT
jgi:hypothetical protein